MRPFPKHEQSCLKNIFAKKQEAKRFRNKAVVEYCLMEHLRFVLNAILQECRKRSQHLERLRQETEEKLSEANNESLQVFIQSSIMQLK